MNYGKKEMKLQATSYKLQANRGFGLLEVVISIGILALVMGAAVYTGRISLRNNIIANQRAQAYNLVRENLEIVRQMRDSTWLDKTVNQWNTPFINATYDGVTSYYLIFSQDKWNLVAGDDNPADESDQITNLDGTKFVNKIFFTHTNESLNSELKTLTNSQNINTADSPVMITAKSIVSWQSYGSTYSVIGAINLTDWKPQI